MTGVLAIWNDCRSNQIEAYEAWYQQEHMASRVRLAGFRVGRRYEAINAHRRFMTSYEVDHPHVVLRDEDYLNLFNNPDPATTAMMRDGFHNAVRTVCSRSVTRGQSRGAVVVAVTIAPGVEKGLDALKDAAVNLEISPALVHLELWISAEQSHARQSKEEILRGGDEKIGAALILEFLRTDPAQVCAGLLQERFPFAQVGVFRLMGELRQDCITAE